MRRAPETPGEKLDGARQRRERRHVDERARAARTEHRAEMPREAEAGHVGYRLSAELAREQSRVPVRRQHGLQTLGERTAGGKALHVGVEHYAGSETLRQEELIAVLEPIESQEIRSGSKAVDGEADQELGRRHRMPPDESDSVLIEDHTRAREHLEQDLLLFLVRRVPGHGDEREGIAG